MVGISGIRAKLCAAAAVLTVASAPAALAGMGQPSPGQIGLQDAASEVAEGIHAFHDGVTMSFKPGRDSTKFIGTEGWIRIWRVK